MHARRVTVMPKDSRFIRQIINIWEREAWITKEPRCFPGRVRGPHAIGRSQGSHRHTGLSVPRTRLTAGQSTGGKARNFKDKLAFKANNLSLRLN